MLVGIALKLVKSLLIKNELFPLAVKLGMEIWKKQVIKFFCFFYKNSH